MLDNWGKLGARRVGSAINYIDPTTGAMESLAVLYGGKRSSLQSLSLQHKMRVYHAYCAAQVMEGPHRWQDAAEIDQRMNIIFEETELYACRTCIFAAYYWHSVVSASIKRKVVHPTMVGVHILGSFLYQ